MINSLRYNRKSFSPKQYIKPLVNYVANKGLNKLFPAGSKKVDVFDMSSVGGKVNEVVGHYLGKGGGFPNRITEMIQPVSRR